MLRFISLTTVLICLSEGFPQSKPGRPSSLVEQYYANIKDLGYFRSANTVSGDAVRSNKYEDVIDKTRTQAETLISTLRKLAANPIASKYMEKTFQAGDCVKTVEEAIASIESGAAIMEGAETELATLMNTVDRINENSDLIETTKTSAGVLRQLEKLLPKLAPSNNPEICGSTFDYTFDALQAVGDVLTEVSEDSSLDISKITILELEISKEILASANLFLKKLKQNFADVKESCNSNKGDNVKALKAIGRMLEDLGVLFKDLGDEQQGQAIRDKATFTDKIIEAIKSFSGSDVGKLSCNSPGDFEATATMLEDLAKIIEEIGLDNLKKQLGVEGIF